MSNKGKLISNRKNYSSIAYSGSVGIEGNTKLNKFSKSNKQSLEEIVSDSYKPINAKLESRAKLVLKYFMPGLYNGILIADFFYRHRKVILNTVVKVAEIWSDESTPVSDKILSTLEGVLQGGAEIAKKEFSKKVVCIVVSEFVNESIGIIEKEGVITTMGKEVELEGHKERFKDLLSDTIEKQLTETFLSKSETKIE